MLRMEQVHVVRYKALVEGQSIRRVAREMEISRNTVRKYLKELLSSLGIPRSTLPFSSDP